MNLRSILISAFLLFSLHDIASAKRKGNIYSLSPNDENNHWNGFKKNHSKIYRNSTDESSK